MAAWGYGKDNGPATWVTKYPMAAGSRQSPIDITPSTAVFDANLLNKKLTTNYHPEENMIVSNTGVSLVASTKTKSVIYGGPLEGEYKLEQFHIHWGPDNKQGSEHTVNGKMYPAELHLVHYNSTKYSSFGEAVDKPDGLAVFGIFLEISSAPHAGLKPVTDLINHIQHKDKTVKLQQEYNPVCLLPDITNYWTYLGSLSTPPCHESVIWIVFQNTITVSEDQVKNLRCLCSGGSGSGAIIDNHRPTLPLGSRTLKASFS